MAEPEVVLRPVEEADVATFLAMQHEEGAAALAAVEVRDAPAFEAHWRRLREDPDIVALSVVVGGRLAGYVLAFPHEGRREIAYWIARRFWGRGVATAAIRRLLELVPDRPLHAGVAEHNVGSQRALERNGFVQVGAEPAQEGPVMRLLRLDG